MQTPEISTTSRSGPYRLALVTIATTILLIFVGGLVTTTGSALAVPDWPTTFGHNMFTFPLSSMVGGVFYEHGHRLLGSLVGILTLALALWVWRVDPRRWVRVLAAVALFGVIAQGVLGGMRVVMLDYVLAIIHGCVAQVFLAILVVLATALSPSWRSQPPPSKAANFRGLAIVAAVLVLTQIIFGAVLTHMATRLDAHIFFAFCVTIVGLMLAEQTQSDAAGQASVAFLGRALMVLLFVQLGLGVGAYLVRMTTAREVMHPILQLGLPTLHRIVGSGILAAVVAIGAHTLRDSPAEVRQPSASGGSAPIPPGSQGEVRL